MTRTTPAIMLGPTGNPSGTHLFMSFKNGRAIRDCQFDCVNFSKMDIKRVEELGKDQTADMVFLERKNNLIEDNKDTDSQAKADEVTVVAPA